MTTKRIIIILAIVTLTYFSVVTGKRRLLIHYENKAGTALFFSGDYKTAIEYYDKLIFWRPEAAGYYYNRGDAYDYDGQYEKAISDYNKSLQLGIGDSLQAILRIALTAKKQGDLKTEEHYLLHLLELSKDNKKYEIEFWAANYHLGRLEFKRNNFRKAIDYYSIAHSTSPSNLEIYHRANSYFAMGEIDSARLDLHHSLSFVKANYVKKYPTSYLAKCDTCSFPFGSKEYELLTEPNGEAIIQTLDEFSEDK